MSRIIFHIDMNAYFASCEIADNPELNKYPLVVCPNGNNRHSIVLTSNYEARKYGVKSAMRLADALSRCPDLIILEPHYDLYSQISREIMSYLQSISPLIEVASIDEAYLDVTDVNCHNDYLQLAKDIQKYILEVIKIPCSIGIGPNKFLAKMGSDMKKPLGIVIMRKREVKDTLWPQPIENLFGAGKKTVEKLKLLHISTIGDLANISDKSKLIDLLGEAQSNYLLQSAYGNGSDLVDPNHNSEYSSLSNSTTYEKDLTNFEEILLNLKVLTNTVSSRLIKHHLVAKNIGIQIRYNDFKTITRQKTLDNYTNDSAIMFKIVKELLDDHLDENRPVRLLGVSSSHLESESKVIKKLSFFDDLDKEEKNHQIQKIVNTINQEYGENYLQIGINNYKIGKFDKSHIKDIKKQIKDINY